MRAQLPRQLAEWPVVQEVEPRVFPPRERAELHDLEVLDGVDEQVLLLVRQEVKQTTTVNKRKALNQAVGLMSGQVPSR